MKRDTASELLVGNLADGNFESWSMSVDDFLEQQSEGGNFQSEGSFGLNLERAFEQLGSVAYPGPHHWILRLVQLANRFKAEEVSVTASLKKIELCFESDFLMETPFLKRMRSSLEHLSFSQSSPEGFLSSALFAALYQGREAVLDLGLVRIKLGKGSCQFEESDGEAHRFRFSLLRKRPWQFWQGSQAGSQIIELLETKCLFSPAKIKVNGRLLDRADGFVLNDHLREFHASQFNAVTGTMQTMKSRVAASLILYDAGTEENTSFIEPPELESFAEKADGIYLWKPGLSRNNEMRPPDDDSPAWILHYPNGSTSFTSYETIVAFNLHGPGNSELPRLRVVRHGVLLLESRLQLEEEEEHLRGCSIVLSDGELQTDLSGLRLVEDEKMEQKIAKISDLVQAGHQCFERCASLVNFA